MRKDEAILNCRGQIELLKTLIRLISVLGAGLLVLIVLVGYGIETLIILSNSSLAYFMFITLGVIVVFAVLFFFCSELQSRLANHYLKNLEGALKEYKQKNEDKKI